MAEGKCRQCKPHKRYKGYLKDRHKKVNIFFASERSIWKTLMTAGINEKGRVEYAELKWVARYMENVSFLSGKISKRRLLLKNVDAFALQRLA